MCIQNEIRKHCIDLGDEGKDVTYGFGFPDWNSEADKKDEISEQIYMPEKNNTKTDEFDISPYNAVLEEYRYLHENHFMDTVLDNVLYANEGIRNFINQTNYSVYYMIQDLAEDGKPELLISLKSDTSEFIIMDIFGIVEGNVRAIIPGDGSVGYRSIYHLIENDEIRNLGSGGALNSMTDIYRLEKDSVNLKLIKRYEYDGWDGDKYTITDEYGNIQKCTSSDFSYINDKSHIKRNSDWILLCGSDRAGSFNSETVYTEPYEEPHEDPYNTHGVVKKVPPYQGIFKAEGTYLAILLYTPMDDSSPIGVIYNITEPYKASNGMVQYTTNSTVGELYGSWGSYQIVGDYNYQIDFYEDSIQLNGGYLNGTYEQISNYGANMQPKDIWLK